MRDAVLFGAKCLLGALVIGVAGAALSLLGIAVIWGEFAP